LTEKRGAVDGSINFIQGAHLRVSPAPKGC
jgi:hypothetical protein